MFMFATVALLALSLTQVAGLKCACDSKLSFKADSELRKQFPALEGKDICGEFYHLSATAVRFVVRWLFVGTVVSLRSVPWFRYFLLSTLWKIQISVMKCYRMAFNFTFDQVLALKNEKLSGFH